MIFKCTFYGISSMTQLRFEGFYSTKVKISHVTDVYFRLIPHWVVNIGKYPK